METINKNNYFSDIKQITDLIQEELNKSIKKGQITIEELKKNLSKPISWSDYLSGLSLLTNNEIINIDDQGIISLGKNIEKYDSNELEFILNEAKEKYDYTLKKLAE